MAKKSSKKDQTSPAYLDSLGHESARAYAFVISIQAGEAGITLPLPDADIHQLLDKTIVGLEEQGRLPWSKLTAERMSVFIDAWTDEMNKLGIRQ